MEIIFYQVFIIFTLILVRIFAKKYLEVACFIWTALTAINLFLPPLIILQLIVIWGTYSVIRPKDAPEFPAESDRSSDNQPEQTTAPSTVFSLLTTLNSSATSVTNAIDTATSSIDRLDRYVQQAKRQQIKDYEIADRTYEANLVKEAARAQEARETALAKEYANDPARAARFNEITAELEALLNQADAAKTQGAIEPALSKKYERGPVRMARFNAVTPKSSLVKTSQIGNCVEIRSLAEELGIPQLVHFTRCDNLSSILHHGLRSIVDCDAQGIRAIRNDAMRLEAQPDGISLSIAFPNYRMFYKHRQLDVNADWAVLILSPKIIWEKECGFFRLNAADSQMRGRPRNEVVTAQAFREMFEASNEPRQHWLRRFDPTNPQAEVMVYEPIEYGLIEAVAFETKSAAEKWAHVLGGIEPVYAGQGKGLFASRAKVRTN